MRSVLIPIMIVAAITGFAGNLEDLKAASIGYVAAMKAVLAISDDSDCPGLVAKAIDYAAAKVAYYMRLERLCRPCSKWPPDKTLITVMEMS